MKKLLAVDNILATFRKTIRKLAECEANHGSHAEACTVEADALRLRSEASKAEAARAAKVKQKLEELIGA